MILDNIENIEDIDDELKTNIENIDDQNKNYAKIATNVSDSEIKNLIATMIESNNKQCEELSKSSYKNKINSNLLISTISLGIASICNLTGLFGIKFSKKNTTLCHVFEVVEKSETFFDIIGNSLITEFIISDIMSVDYKLKQMSADELNEPAHMSNIQKGNLFLMIVAYTLFVLYIFNNIPYIVSIVKHEDLLQCRYKQTGTCDETFGSYMHTNAMPFIKSTPQEKTKQNFQQLLNILIAIPTLGVMLSRIILFYYNNKQNLTKKQKLQLTLAIRVFQLIMFSGLLIDQWRSLIFM